VARRAGGARHHHIVRRPPVTERSDTPEPHRNRAEWAAEFPEAARALARLASAADPEAMNEWRQKYPDASKAWGRMVLSSPDVVRKMRMTDPDWEPPYS
jgi:hypothetical protein